MTHLSKVATAILILLVLALFQNCSSEPTTETPLLSTFSGETEAVERAEAMFSALGGKEVWANLKSLYVKAQHEEPNLKFPYQSQIWRDLDDFKMRIQQAGSEFEVIGLFSENEVEIQYLHKDSLRWFSEQALKAEKFSHEHNVYVLWKKLATQQNIEVKNGVEGRLEFYQNETLLCAFGLDEKNRPHRFYQPNFDGSENASLFEVWNTSEGFTHPAGGGPTDGNFSYKTEIWKPSNKNLEQAFGVEYKAKPFRFSELNWLEGKWEQPKETLTRIESWKKTDENNYWGESYILTETDSIFSEKLSLQKRGEDIFYTAQIPNQNDGTAIDFKLLGAFEGRYVFLNPEHDFPQKIVYQKVEKDSLIVRVSGVMEGQWRTIPFPFKRQ